MIARQLKKVSYHIQTNCPHPDLETPPKSNPPFFSPHAPARARALGPADTVPRRWRRLGRVEARPHRLHERPARRAREGVPLHALPVPAKAHRARLPAPAHRAPDQGLFGFFLKALYFFLFWKGIFFFFFFHIFSRLFLRLFL